MSTTFNTNYYFHLNFHHCKWSWFILKAAFYFFFLDNTAFFTDILESLRQKKTLLTKRLHFPRWCSGQTLSEVCMTTAFWRKLCMWEIILGSRVQRPLEQFLCVTAARCCAAFCALLGHRCGGEGNRCSHWSQSAHLSERIITSCFAFCLYGTWLLRVSVSGLARGARLWRTRSEVTAAAASAGAFDSVGPPPHL